MGNIARQSIRNFFWSNWGIIIGSIYTLAIVPKAFNDHPELWGLIQLLLYFSQILLSLVTLSIPTIILRYYPRFSQQGKKDQFFSASLILLLLASLVVSLVFICIGKPLGESQGDEGLYANYFWVIVPVLFFSALFELYTAWSKAQLKSTVPNFLKESFIKSWNFVVIILYFYQLIGFQLFLLLYFAVYAIQFLMIWQYSNRTNTITFIPKPGLVKEIYSKELVSFMGFNILGIATYTLMNKIDILMIGKIQSLEYVSYYSVALAIIAFIQLPEKSISAISVPSLSHFLNNNDTAAIRNLYRKTSLNQFILSAYIFLGVWVNIHNITQYLGEKFGNIEYVILFLGLAKLVDVITGLNGPLISMSNYYRIAFWMQIILVILLFFTNYLLIPRYGINGAAFGSFLSICIYNSMKTVYVYRKFKIWPFTRNTYGALLIVAATFALITLIPVISNLWIDLIVRSVALTLLYFMLIIGFRTSEDITSVQKQFFKTLFKK
ncbi:MAG TPA: polysaccharide biosynthesis C-terminal domain-containing protein [Bacteroidales bacterium]|nr:polysaccharide biosynthesis C-terminal domain-containing protein [Bacteroidales bacterium]